MLAYPKNLFATICYRTKTEGISGDGMRKIFADLSKHRAEGVCYYLLPHPKKAVLERFRQGGNR